jgi:hypothetical protein
MTSAEREPHRRTGKRRSSNWPEGSDADRAEGSLPWADGDEEERPRPAMPPDAPEADVLEQAESADLDEEDRAR